MQLDVETKENDHSAPAPNIQKQFTAVEAKQIGEALSIYWEEFNVDQFIIGLNVELEHGRRSPATDVTHHDPLATGKIALAHLNEFPDYYTRLAAMESEAMRGTPVKRKTEKPKKLKYKPYKNQQAGVYNSNEVITWKKKK